MAAKLQVDYDALKAEYIAGANIKALATREGIKPDTLQVYATRHKWATQRTKARHSVSNAVSQASEDDLKGRAYKWVQKSVLAIDQAMQAWIDIGPGSKRQELRVDAETLSKLIDAGRKAYGLDRNESMQVRIGVWVGSSEAGVRPKVIDAEAVHEKAPSAN